MQELHATVAAVTTRIRERSRGSREAYLERLRSAAERGPRRAGLACSNLAHVFAACDGHDKAALAAGEKPSVAIVSAYNDMLSAHQPFETYPAELKAAVRAAGGVARFAGGVPAMCDGVTQGTAGMELSLWSRDVIAQATAVALSHDVFDAVICLGVCDKIVPGLLIGALAFGHLPFVFVPAGPMPSGLSNTEKARVRELAAEGKVGRPELLAAEAASYHSPGTCTFFGTANSNQLFMEVLGLHLPGASFVNPGTPLRAALTAAAGRQATQLAAGALSGTAPGRPIGEIVDERAIVNAVVALLATGGSTNHTIHLVAVARAAGILIDWSDFDELSAVVPLLARIYPNGTADVNHFHRAGGTAFLIGELLHAGLLHPDVSTIVGPGLAAYRQVPRLVAGELLWEPGPAESLDLDVLRPAAKPFQPSGGLRLLEGNLGRAIVKVSALKSGQRRLTAPARIFTTQEDLERAFGQGALTGDFVAVVRFQGPRANGMPELHQLMPWLGVLQDRGQKVALVTDGRLSGASGKVLAALHVTPEAATGGPLARLRPGDLVTIDADAGSLEAEVDAADWAARKPTHEPLAANRHGLGRELFASFRSGATTAEEGATTFGDPLVA